MTVSILRPCPEHGPRGCVVCTECGHVRIPVFSNPDHFAVWHALTPDQAHRTIVASEDTAYRAAFEEVAEAAGIPRAGRSIIEWGDVVAEKVRGGR